MSDPITNGSATTGGDAGRKGRRSASDVVRDLGVLARRNYKLIILAVAAIIFITLLTEVVEGEIMRLDSLAYSFVVLRMRAPWLTPVMEGLTSLASPAVLVGMLLVVAAFAPGKRPGWCAALNLVLVTLLNQLIKSIIQRPRPDGYRLIPESGYSFPSGHSMVSMAFYGFLAWMVWRYELDEKTRRLYLAAFAVLIGCIGLSRIYLGVHYASDVLAGFCVSLVWLALYTRLIAPLFLPELCKPREARAGESPRT